MARSVCRAAINDVQCSAAYMRSPCFYTTEISFSLPAAGDLWYAPDHQAWRALWLQKDVPEESLRPTLQDVFDDPSILASTTHGCDSELSLLLALHCLWPQITAYLDSKPLHERSSLQKPGHNIMWLEVQRQDLYKRLGTFKQTMDGMSTSNAEIHLGCELFMMTLFVSPGDIQRFAGQFGEKESRRKEPSLRASSASDEARYAMWHAGQVLRAAKLFKPTQLRGFYATAIYQACLTLALPFLLESLGPSNGSRDITHDSLVVLNGPDSMAIKAYLSAGLGQPALLFGTDTKVLSDVQLIPTIIARLFEDNHALSADQLPPLLERLVVLVSDLARLAEHGAWKAQGGSQLILA